MGPIFLGLPNHTKEPYVTVSTAGTVGLEPTDMEGEWLKTEEPSELARLTTLDPYLTQWKFDSHGTPVSLDGFSLVNHNIYPGGQVRFVSFLNSASLVQPSKKPAAVMSATTNVTGVVGNVDEDISSPDGLLVGPTTTTDYWEATFSFGTLTGTLKAESDMLAIVLRAQRKFNGAGADNPYTYPGLFVYLNDTGSGIRRLGYRAVTNTATNGQILIFPFSKSDLLVDPTGAGISVIIGCTPGTSASGSSYGVLEALSLYYETVPIGDPTTLTDSGWITVQGNANPTPITPTRNIHHILSAPVDALGYTIMLRGDQTRHYVDPPRSDGRIPVGYVPESPDTVVQAGVAPCGAAIKLSENLEVGQPLPGIDIESGAEGETARGQSYGVDFYRMRKTESIELIVTRAELQELQEKLLWLRGNSGAVYIILQPDDAPGYQWIGSFWATLKSMSDPVWFGYTGNPPTPMYKVSVQFEERL